MTKRTDVRLSCPGKNCQRCFRTTVNDVSGLYTGAHPYRSIVLKNRSGRLAEIRQLTPVAASVNPDRAIGAKGDYLSSRQGGYLFDLSGLVNSRWVGLGHTGSLRMTNDR